MNKHLFKTRLASIAHYKNEIDKLEEAKAATTGTREDLINSLLEFCPFSEGHIIMRGDLIFKIEKVVKVIEAFGKPNDFSFEINVSCPAIDGGFQGRVNNKYFHFSEVDSWKILNEKEEVK